MRWTRRVAQAGDRETGTVTKVKASYGFINRPGIPEDIFYSYSNLADPSQYGHRAAVSPGQVRTGP